MIIAMANINIIKKYNQNQKEIKNKVDELLSNIENKKYILNEKDIIDINYITDQHRRYIGARILVDSKFNIWIDTQAKEIYCNKEGDSYKVLYIQEDQEIDKIAKNLYFINITI